MTQKELQEALEAIEWLEPRARTDKERERLELKYSELEALREELFA